MIPTFSALGCPGCEDNGVTLEGEIRPCDNPECDYGRAFRAMTPNQKAEAARYLRELWKHLRACDFCQRSTKPTELCRTGGPLLARLLAWLIPEPN